MRIAFAYAGQGSQFPGMGEDFYQKCIVFRQQMNEAETIIQKEAGFSLRDCCFHQGNPDVPDINKTRYTQPCMLAFAMGITHLFRKENISPVCTLGLSLGEYSALYAAGVLDADTVLPLIAYRGKVMEEAVQGRDVKMVAVLKMEKEVIEKTCQEASDQCESPYVVEIANDNCPGQIVISGDTQAVDIACELLKEQGAKRLIPLKVSGPFHTSLMKPAGDALREYMKNVTFHEAEATIIHNLTAKPKKSGENYIDLLEQQVQHTVLFTDSIHELVGQEIDCVIEIGPGNTLSKFIKKTESNLKVYSVSTVEDFENVLQQIRLLDQ